MLRSPRKGFRLGVALETSSLIAQLEAEGSAVPELAPEQPPSLIPLASHLASSIRKRLAVLKSRSLTFEVRDPDWCRAHPELAGRLRAEIFAAAYGAADAWSEMDPAANTAEIAAGTADLYLLLVEGVAVGTTSVLDLGAGVAELGRSASYGGVGNALIQDLRILSWLIRSDMCARYHTLRADIRTAPDRVFHEEGGLFTVRGGEAASHYWSGLPSLRVAGLTPLYLIWGELEQLAHAYISRLGRHGTPAHYLADQEHRDFVSCWLACYGDPELPPTPDTAGGAEELTFAAPGDSDLSGSVCATVTASLGGPGANLPEVVDSLLAGPSPAVQVVLPVDRDTSSLQKQLTEAGFQLFGYLPFDRNGSPALLFGKVARGVTVVPTHWDEAGKPNPYWKSAALADRAARVASSW
jgi:hypothetical protein